MLKVGITGGIGSGKTSICKIFEILGIPVYYADDRAKWLMENEPELIGGIKKLFGQQAYFKDGALNRKYIAKLAFGDPGLLKQLNGLVHPAVARDIKNWHAVQKGFLYTLKEAALIFENQSHRQLNQVITVTAPLELRIKRVMERDGVTRQEVESRMSKQMPEEEKIKLADYVIYNDGKHSLIRQVLDIHGKLCQI